MVNEMGFRLQKVVLWQVYQFEVWIVVFDYWYIEIVYLGGDDGFLRGWDIRVFGKVFFISKRYIMGVCSIQSSFYWEYVLVIGSYDEYILLWDIWNMKQLLVDMFVQGGVWRIKWYLFYYYLFLVVCMYSGFKIFNC